MCSISEDYCEKKKINMNFFFHIDFSLKARKSVWICVWVSSSL